MFQLLSTGNSTPSGAKAVLDESENPNSCMTSRFAAGPTSAAYNGPPVEKEDYDRKASGKKQRSRRRRKGKSRNNKVEPLSSASKALKAGASNAAISSTMGKKQHDAPMTKSDLYFAMDIEMVGIGPGGVTSAPGRVSIVNWDNQIVLDTYVTAPAPVTDYRTYVSGITAEQLQPRPGHPLMTFEGVRSAVQNILQGKILIGHGLENDLNCLGLYHPICDIRDTATYSYFMREHRDQSTQTVSLVPKKLRDLAWEKLGRLIQDPAAPHCPVEDAIAALDLYKEARQTWEDHLVKVAQLEEIKQQELLAERRREQELEQQRRQQQLRRWQWLPGQAPTPQPVFPVHPYAMMHPSMPLVPPSMQPPPPESYRMQPSQYPGPASGLMLQSPRSAAASAYLQGPPTPRSHNTSPRNSSSWFSFSRRGRQQPQQQQQPEEFDYPIVRTTSHESTTTQATITTVQSSFSLDHSSPSVPRCGWNGVDPEREEKGFRTGEAEEAWMENELPPMMEDPIENSILDDTSETACTETTESMSHDNTLPAEYVPPRYFTNPDPNPTASSSWFKLFGSSTKSSSSKAQSEKGDESDGEMDDNSETQQTLRRASDSDAAARSSLSVYNLFSGKRLSRRASESCMTSIAENHVDEHSRSLHG